MLRKRIKSFSLSLSLSLSLSQNGGPQLQGEVDFGNKCRNVVIHGLKGSTDKELIESVLDICQILEVIVFASDIEKQQLGRPDTGSDHVVPIHVTLISLRST